METCTNCERKIGNMETPYVFRGSIVCKDCHQILSPMPPAARTAAASARPKPFANAVYKILLLAFIVLGGLFIYFTIKPLLADNPDIGLGGTLFLAAAVIGGILSALIPVIIVILIIRFIIWLIRKGTRADEAIENQRQILEKLKR